MIDRAGSPPMLIIKAVRRPPSGKPPYGHVAYTRHTKDGKLVQVKARGVKPQKAPSESGGAEAADTAKTRTTKEYDKKGRIKAAVKRLLAAKVARRDKGKGEEVQLSPVELDTVLTEFKFALVSAGPNVRAGEDKEHDAAFFKARHEQLHKRLKEAGYTFSPVIGMYGGREDSFLVMVHDAERDDVRQMGIDYNQDSVIYGEGGKYWMHYTTGEKAEHDLVVGAKSWKSVPNAEDYYTVYRHEDGTVSKFSINFDFDAEKPFADLKLAIVLATGSLIKAVSHEQFVAAVMSQDGDVTEIGEGRFGAKKVQFANGTRGTLKPKLFSNDVFRGIPRDTQYLREVAAYALDKGLLQFDIIPPTILTVYESTPSSVQSWVLGVPARGVVPRVFDRREEDWKERVAKFAALVDVEGLRKVVLFDLIVNNTDRHAKNCLFDTFSKRVWAIDNGLSFGRHYTRYYNVFHKYLFRKNLQLDAKERKKLENVTLSALTSILGRYLRPKEVEETYWRIQWMLEQPDLGFQCLAGGYEGRNEYPSRHEWFKAAMSRGNKLVAAISKMGKERR